MALQRPSQQRESILSFVTPCADILFWEKVDFTKQENRDASYGDPHWDKKKYPHHFLVFFGPLTNNRKDYRFVYAAKRPEQDLYNFNYTQVSLGGLKFDTVERTYIYLRESFSESDDQAGTAMPVGPDDKFLDKGYILMTRKNHRIGDKDLDSLFTVEVKTYIKRTYITNQGFDELSKRNLASVSRWYYRDEVVVAEDGDTPARTVDWLFDHPEDAFWDASIEVIGSTLYGTVKEGQQLSDGWFLITTKQTIAGESDGAGGILVSEYPTTHNYFWPPVLYSLDLMIWDKKAGGSDITPAVEFDPEGYRGPCNSTTTIRWKPSQYDDLATEQMNPRGISYSSPLFRVNIPACLHLERFLYANFGTEDPVYEQANNTRTYAATHPTEWPDTITANDDQKTARGGFLRTTIEIDQPENNGATPGTPEYPEGLFD